MSAPGRPRPSSSEVCQRYDVDTTHRKNPKYSRFQGRRALGCAAMTSVPMPILRIPPKCSSRHGRSLRENPISPPPGPSASEPNATASVQNHGTLRISLWVVRSEDGGRFVSAGGNATEAQCFGRFLYDCAVLPVCRAALRMRWAEVAVRFGFSQCIRAVLSSRTLLERLPLNEELLPDRKIDIERLASARTRW